MQTISRYVAKIASRVVVLAMCLAACGKLPRGVR